jgi:hypothetical protein
MTKGMIAKFSIVDRRLFRSLEVERISDALRSEIKHITLMTLTSDTPNVANMLTTDVVLKTLVVLIVDSMDDSIGALYSYFFAISGCHNLLK